jgi:hypothetical protein
VLAAIALAPGHPNHQIDSVKTDGQRLHTTGPLALVDHIPTSALRADIELVQRLHGHEYVAAAFDLGPCATVTLGNTKYLVQQRLFH